MDYFQEYVQVAEKIPVSGKQLLNANTNVRCWITTFYCS